MERVSPLDALKNPGSSYRDKDNLNPDDRAQLKEGDVRDPHDILKERLQKLEKKKFYQNRSLPLSDVHGLQAVPHRCNQRLDDLLTGLTQFPPRTRGTFGTYIKCLFSDKGDEPSGPFVYLDSDKPMFGKQVHYLPEEEEQAEE